MTKLEAWQAWCATASTGQLADQFTLDNSSHGKAFSFAWDAAHEACAKVCDFEVARLTAIDEPRPALAVGICAAAIRARGQA